MRGPTAVFVDVVIAQPLAGLHVVKVILRANGRSYTLVGRGKTSDTRIGRRDGLFGHRPGRTGIGIGHRGEALHGVVVLPVQAEGTGTEIIRTVGRTRHTELASQTAVGIGLHVVFHAGVAGGHFLLTGIIALHVLARRGILNVIAVGIRRRDELPVRVAVL